MDHRTTESVGLEGSDADVPRSLGRSWSSPQSVFSGCSSAALGMNCGGDALALGVVDFDKVSVSVLRADSTQWTPAQVIANSSAEEPTLAIDERGTAFAAWKACKKPAVAADCTRSADWKNWDKPHELVPPGLVGSSIELAARAGCAVAVWDQPGQGVWSTRYVDREGWEPARSIEPGAIVDESRQPRVAVRLGENAVAAWTTSDGLWVSQRPRGEGWGPVQHVATQGSGRDAPLLAVLPKELAVILWTPGVNDRYMAVQFRGPKMEQELPPIEVARSEESPSDPGLAIDKGGRCIAIWLNSPNGDDRSLIARVILPKLEREEVVASGPVRAMPPPQLAMDIYGNAWVVWATVDDLSKVGTLWCRRCGADGRWGAPFQLGQSKGAPSELTLAMSLDGDHAIVGWNDDNEYWVRVYR